MRPKTKDSQRSLIRCLGPGPEHRFMSHNPKRNRICPKCTEAIKLIREERVLQVHYE